jgi:hypothetical protein
MLLQTAVKRLQALIETNTTTHIEADENTTGLLGVYREVMVTLQQKLSCIAE